MFEGLMLLFIGYPIVLTAIILLTIYFLSEYKFIGRLRIWVASKLIERKKVYYKVSSIVNNKSKMLYAGNSLIKASIIFFQFRLVYSSITFEKGRL